MGIHLGLWGWRRGEESRKRGKEQRRSRQGKVRSREVMRVAVTGRVRVHGTGKLRVRSANGGVVYVII
jgi:hypothetical protein